jgi:hypothetical protein
MLIFGQVVDKIPFGGGGGCSLQRSLLLYPESQQSDHTVTLPYSKIQININLPTESRSFKYWLFRTDYVFFITHFFVVFPPLFVIGEICDSEIMRVQRFDLVIGIIHRRIT